MPPRPPYALVPDPAPHREADLESRIGSHWLNRIGIAALLIGVSYFLKFAFENNWIGPAGRVPSACSQESPWWCGVNASAPEGTGRSPTL